MHEKYSQNIVLLELGRNIKVPTIYIEKLPIAITSDYEPKCYLTHVCKLKMEGN